MAPAGTGATTAATSRASGGGARCRGPQGAPWTTMSSRTAAPPHRPTPHRRVGAPTRAATREGTTGTTSDLLLNDRPGYVTLICSGMTTVSMNRVTCAHHLCSGPNTRTRARGDVPLNEGRRDCPHRVCIVHILAQRCALRFTLEMTILVPMCNRLQPKAGAAAEGWSCSPRLPLKARAAALGWS